MLRTVITIDESRCDGCGRCVTGCHEGALRIIDGKARLVREDYCDGLGACLGECPRGAIRQERREVAAFALPPDHPMHGRVKTFEEVAAERAAAEVPAAAPAAPAAPAAGPGHGPEGGHAAGCPGSRARTLEPRPAGAAFPAAAVHGGCPGSQARTLAPRAPAAAPAPTEAVPSDLGQWPVQLRLVSPTAPYLHGADLLVCADCVPFAVADFHARYLRGHAVVVGCPKLDDQGEMVERLARILAHAQPRSLTVLRMEVPCCGGIAQAALAARQAVAPGIPTEVHTIAIGGGIRIAAA